MTRRRLLSLVAVLGLLTLGWIGPPSARAAAVPQVFSGVGATQVSAQMRAFEAAIGGSSNPRGEGLVAGGYRAPAWTQGPGTYDMPQGTDPGGVPWINEEWLNGYGINLTTPGSAFTFTDDGFGEIDPSYPALFTTGDGTHPLAPMGSTETDVSFLVPDLYQAPWQPGQPGTADGSRPGMIAGVAGLGAVFLNSEISNGSSIDYRDATGRSLGVYPVPVAGQGQPAFLAVLFPEASVAAAKILTGTAPLAPGTHDTAAGGSGTNLVALDGVVASEPVPGPGVSVSPATSGYAVPPTAAVQGRVNDPEGVPTVTVNGIAATVRPDGSWTAVIPIRLGSNAVVATATDSRGLSNRAVTYVDGVSALPGPPPVATPAPSTCALHPARATVAARARTGRRSRRLSRPVVSIRMTCTAAGHVRVTGTVVAQSRAGRHHRTVSHRFTLHGNATQVAAGRTARLILALPARVVAMLRAGERATVHLVLTVAGGAGKPVTVTLRL